MTTDMKKLILIALLIISASLGASAQDAYKILSECDTTVKAKIEKVTLGSREVRHFVYEYPSTDADGQPVTISGIVMVPAEIANGTTPCDGIILFNHHTIGSPDEAPSQGELDVPSGILANPLKPNYIVVMSDYIGYGSSIGHKVAYLCGDAVKFRNKVGMDVCSEIINNYLERPERNISRLMDYARILRVSATLEKYLEVKL